MNFPGRSLATRAFPQIPGATRSTLRVSFLRRAGHRIMQWQDRMHRPRDRPGAVAGAGCPVWAVGRVAPVRAARSKCQRALVGRCSELTCQTRTRRVAGSAVAEITPEMGDPKPKAIGGGTFPLPCGCSLPRSKVRPGSARAQGGSCGGRWEGDFGPDFWKSPKHQRKAKQAMGTL